MRTPLEDDGMAGVGGVAPRTGGIELVVRGVAGVDVD